VIGTGETHSVRKLCELAFSHVGLDYEEFVIQDPRFYRPAEVDILVADPQRAVEQLGWRPNIQFEELIQLMVDADLKRLALEID
jgi:GDPmannose 4,6-dehydratase